MSGGEAGISILPCGKMRRSAETEKRMTRKRRPAADQSYYYVKLFSLDGEGFFLKKRRVEQYVCVCACDGEMGVFWSLLKLGDS